MPKYSLSSGEYIEKSIIDRRIVECKKAYKEWFLDTYGGHFCERCGDSSGRLEFSHIVSTKECQNNGVSEMSYSDQNLELLCSRCHGLIERWQNRKRFMWYLMRKEGKSFMALLARWHRENFEGL